ncbi:MAG: T9SS type A sorting domain-containing protein [Candidatus Kapabacteria bacterium]|nr:T9SS type A sorting domain-containing protein [Candidatus Kapabacteria bacterium]
MVLANNTTNLVPLEQSTNSLLFDLFPNPTSDILNIHLQNDFIYSQKVQIFDLLGQKLLEKDIPIGSENIEINISNFLSGIYLLKIGDEVQRVVK